MGDHKWGWCCLCFWKLWTKFVLDTFTYLQPVEASHVSWDMVIFGWFSDNSAGHVLDVLEFSQLIFCWAHKERVTVIQFGQDQTLYKDFGGVYPGWVWWLWYLLVWQIWCWYVSWCVCILHKAVHEMDSSPTVIEISSILLSCCNVQKKMNSILSSFGFRRLNAIQVLTSINALFQSFYASFLWCFVVSDISNW